MKRLQTYSDYRSFLSDLFDERKSKNSKFSYQACALKLKTSRSYLKLVFSKKRHISIGKLNAVCDLFQLKEYEKQWLVFLFLANTTEDPAMSDYFMTVIESISYSENHRGKSEKFNIHQHRSKIYDDWINLAIYEMVNLSNSKWDANWFYEKMNHFEGVTVDRIQASMNYLFANNFVALDDSRYFQTEKNFEVGMPALSSNSLQRFKIGHMVSSEATDLLSEGKLPGPGRMQILAVALTENEIKEVCRLYDELKVKVENFGLQARKGDRVLFMSNNLFPITKNS